MNRLPCCLGWAALCWGCLSAASAAAQPTLPMPREHHPWGQFPAGAWKTVRTTAETFDDKGQVVNVTVTDTQTTLLSVEESAYSLRSIVTVEIAGRRVASTTQITRHGYYGETPGQSVTVKRLPDATLTIDGRALACQVREVVIEGEGQRLTSTLHYSPEQPPFVLRREMSVEGDGDEKRHSATVEVIALDLPQRIRGVLHEASYVKTTQKLPQTTKVTLEVHCQEVPGGVAGHWASEADAGGRVVRRSTLELLDYGVPTTGVETRELPVRPRRLKGTRRTEVR